MSDYRSDWVKIAAAVVLPNVGGIWGSRITRANLEPWYAELNKPKWRPPNFVFAPVWTGIYSSIGYASYLVYRDVTASAGGWNQTAQLALGLYANQMILNWAWTPIFFKYHSLKWSMVELAALTVSAAACGRAFYHINPVAGWIFVPYVAWLSFATFLNYTIYKINGREAGGGAESTATITELKKE